MLVNDEQGMMLKEEVWPNLRYSLGFAIDWVKSRNQIFNLGTDIWKECAIHSTFLTIAIYLLLIWKRRQYLRECYGRPSETEINERESV